MKGSTKVMLVLFALFVIGICGAGIEMTMFPRTTTGEVYMIQPNGWIPWRDEYYANGVNVPNSEANLNNAQAELAMAEAERAKAEAEAAIVEANGPVLQAQSFGCGFGAVVVTAVIMVILLIGAMRHDARIGE